MKLAQTDPPLITLPAVLPALSFQHGYCFNVLVILVGRLQFTIASNVQARVYSQLSVGSCFAPVHHSSLTFPAWDAAKTENMNIDVLTSKFQLRKDSPCPLRRAQTCRVGSRLGKRRSKECILVSKPFHIVSRFDTDDVLIYV